MYRPDYEGATQLLRASLMKHNLNVPQNDLYDAVLDYFEDNDFYLTAT